MATAPHAILTLSKLCPQVTEWVESVRNLTQPASVHWCEGSDSEIARLTAQLTASGELLQLNEKEFPGCQLARSNPSDVARVEHLTFVCTRNKEDAGPNNNWMAPADAHEKMRAPVRRLHEGPHAVCGALLHGTAGFAAVALWR